MKLLIKALIFIALSAVAERSFACIETMQKFVISPADNITTKYSGWFLTYHNASNLGYNPSADQSVDPTECLKYWIIFSPANNVLLGCAGTPASISAKWSIIKDSGKACTLVIQPMETAPLVFEITQRHAPPEPPQIRLRSSKVTISDEYSQYDYEWRVTLPGFNQ